MVSEAKNKDPMLDLYDVPCHDAGLAERIILQARRTPQRTPFETMNIWESLAVIIKQMIPYPAVLVTACLTLGVALGVTLNTINTENSDRELPISYYYDTTGEF